MRSFHLMSTKTYGFKRDEVSGGNHISPLAVEGEGLDKTSKLN